MTCVAIGNLFHVIAATANSAGDTLSDREAVDIIVGAIEQLKPLIVEKEVEAYRDIQADADRKRRMETDTKRKGPRK